MRDELLMLGQALAGALDSAHPSDWTPPDDGSIATADWTLCTELGWDHAGLSENLGGLGEGIESLVLLARACAEHRLPIPLVETALGRRALAAGDVAQPPEGTIVTVAWAGSGAELRPGSGPRPRLNGALRGVAWGRHAQQVLAIGPEGTLLIADLGSPGVQIDPGVNLAGEARDDIRFEDAEYAEIDGARGARAASLIAAAGPLLRSAQIAAAIGRARALTREHTGSRKQFGRPLAGFQLVSAHLAEMAAQAALVEAMLGEAVRAHDAGAPEPSVSSLAYVSAQAATAVARAAHQCHGAIGVTREYQLHHFTRRLWSWRDEAGSEREWCRSLGCAALAAGARLWASTQPHD